MLSVSLTPKVSLFQMATGCLQMFISSFTELELKMNGIERVKYYSEVPVEAPYGDGDGKVVEATAGWPREGAVSFRGVCARYRPGLDLVLNEVSFEVAGGQKVGVCGRTGSGKSS